MDDFLAAIVGTILEALLEFASEALLSLLARAVGKGLAAFLELRPVATLAGLLLLGILSGAVSLLIFPHPLIHPSRIHGISLVLSPTLAGLGMSLVGRFLRRRGTKTVRIESFAYAFTFAFAMALVRFAIVR